MEEPPDDDEEPRSGGGGGGGGGEDDDGVARDRLREFQAQIFELEDLFQVCAGIV